MTAPSLPDEAALTAFLAPLSNEAAPCLRTLAHSWQAAGGSLQVGKMTVRLVATSRDGRPFTAGTLHASHPSNGPVVELARVLLTNHGVDNGDWTRWSDELAEMQTQGFDAAAKYPTVRVEGLGDAGVARLALGLRDLCRLAHGQPA